MSKFPQRCLLLILVTAICVSCHSMHSRLQAIAGSSDIAVIKDAKGGYWAFPGSTMKLLEKNRVKLTGDHKVAYCAEGGGKSEKLAEELMDLRNRASYAGGFGERSVSSSGTTVTTTTGPGGESVTQKNDDAFSLDQCTVGTPKEGAEIEVAEILYHGADRNR